MCNIIKFLENNKGKWFTTKEIKQITKNRSTISNLTRMYKSLVLREMYSLYRKNYKRGYKWKIK